MVLLKKDEDMYLDNEGVSWETPSNWLFTGILGGCGCGSAGTFGEYAVKLLTHFGTPHEERDWSVYDDEKYEILAHWFDSKKLLEHGTSIAGSWLTDFGKDVLETIKTLT